MTQGIKRKPADVLREARRRDSDRKRDRVFRTVEVMRAKALLSLSPPSPDRPKSHNGSSTRMAYANTFDARVRPKRPHPLNASERVALLVRRRYARI